MLYKTLVLNLLEQNPQLHERLRRARKLLSALNHYSTELKSSHEALKQRLSLAKPLSDEKQIAAEAMEMALEQLQALLRSAFPADEDAPISLDGAMAYIRNHSPHA